MITVVIPTYNEAEYIGKVLEFLESSEPREKEILIVDGGSKDDTLKILQAWALRLPGIRIFHNPRKYVPYALNLAIINSSGNPIIRLDAHTEYENDYLKKILETFDNTHADIVGGPMLKKGKTNFQKSVAYATSSPFGIGDSKIHKSDYSGETDHVYLGAWKRSIFDEIGLFDERLVRNQDDEFHYRAKSKGKKVYLNQEIRSYYYPRKNIILLSKQYFQYGKYKPLVLKKINSEIKFRHLMPPLFVIYLFILILNFLPHYSLIPLALYFLLLIIYSTFNRMKLISKLYSLIVFPVIHLSYGLGVLIGLPITITEKDEKSLV